MSVSDTNKNRGTHGDSSFMLGGLPSSSENPPALAAGSVKLSDERITKKDELNGIELWNIALFTPRWWKPWYTFFYIDCPQFLSFNLFDKYGVNPFFFRYKEHEDGKYIGVTCCVKKSRIDDFLVCMHEMQRNMTICGYSDYEEFCRKLHEEWDEEEDDANE